ncbi:uncharacterized protein LOC108667105 [Hyalella azteca]|uniref:Uncharacterized protein LOC108667105 n=1 Tax=Hyalella azteca TaxID=294128 RepID=A0A8B7N6R2_HYAAZ|nr:uncharacterized protein LOC108667105 [Hyalella azteca]
MSTFNINRRCELLSLPSTNVLGQSFFPSSVADGKNAYSSMPYSNASTTHYIANNSDTFISKEVKSKRTFRKCSTSSQSISSNTLTVDENASTVVSTNAHSERTKMKESIPPLLLESKSAKAPKKSSALLKIKAMSNEATCSNGPKNGIAKKAKKRVIKTQQDYSNELDSWALLDQNPMIVYFDLETTGLAYSHEIVQIACVCSSLDLDGGNPESIFNAYALPDGDFDPMASSVTGLTKQKEALFLNGTRVPSTSLSECLAAFVLWLRVLGRPVLLLGHNSKSFDAPRLLLALWNCQLLHAFQDLVYGFSDSLPWARKMNPKQSNFKLEVLSELYCPRGMSTATHNAIEDCLALQVVVHSMAGLPAAKLPLSYRDGKTNICNKHKGNSERINYKHESKGKNVGEKMSHSVGFATPNGNGFHDAQAMFVEGTSADHIVLSNNELFSDDILQNPDKINLLESLEPFVFSIESVMKLLKKSVRGKAFLSLTGS